MPKKLGWWVLLVIYTLCIAASFFGIAKTESFLVLLLFNVTIAIAAWNLADLIATRRDWE